MKKLTGLIIALVCSAFQGYTQDRPDWENPEVFERNQVPPHAALMPYGNMEQALAGNRKSSPFHLSLNGTWKFHWAENLDETPGDFFEPGYQRGDWKEIRVPSNWQMEGFGYPLFRNVGLPHPYDPPEVPRDFNPVGSYYRTFHVPATWKGRQVFLHFEGVQSASWVWINGREVGYNQGGMEPAEYEITPYLKKGENSIAVRVLRYCDGSYMEDQDTWRLSGIFRDVYLMATPGIHIRDFYITTDLDKDYRNAMLEVEAEVASYQGGKPDGYSLDISLFDPDLKPVPGGSGSLDLKPVSGGSRSLDLQSVPEGSGSRILEVDAMKDESTSRVYGTFEISDPLKWSAEYPRLYTLVMELKDEKGEVLEIMSSRVGFREVEVIDQAICINGVPVKFNGVNSHMLHPRTGHAMDVGTMRKDLHIMKQFNINCVRTSHYPPNVEYIDLADELGIYIVDETGDEAHAYTYISNQPEWREQYLDRMRKMVYRDRNHPSVVIWSAGNESGPGENICALIEEGKRIDPGRPGWMYGGNRDEDPETNPIKCEDIVGPRYLHPFRLEQRFAKSDDPRPSFMDEYIAATGNSLGGLDEYWELIRKYRRLTGGAIWDWISPGITMPVVSTRDESPGNIKCVFMNRARLVPGADGQALYLSGHDDWLEVYRDPALDIDGEALTLSFRVKPEAYNGNAAFLTKGDYQFGIIQSDEEHLEFYLNTGRKASLKGRLPDDWTGKWHHVAGIYDGKKMELYVDGSIIGTRQCRGKILNSPYGVILGKSAELRDGYRGYMCHATIDKVRIFADVIPVADLEMKNESLVGRSQLWLDFETSEKEGEYYSIGIPGRTYGLVWPDRSIQPELWQLKKTPQPVCFHPVNLERGEIRVTNHHHFRNLKELDTRWVITENGTAIQNGIMDLDIPAGGSDLIRIPFERPDLTPGSIYHLLVSCHTRIDQAWADAGHEVAWEQFELPFFVERTDEVWTGGPPEVEETGSRLILKGEGFSYTFDKTAGVLTSMIISGKEMVNRGLTVNVWRAPLANDLDSWNFWHTDIGYTREWMGKETANGWRSTGLDRLVQDVDQFTWKVDDRIAGIDVETSIHAMNYTTGFKVRYHYEISGDGKIELTTKVSPRGYLTRWIPKIGLQMELPDVFSKLEWFGRGPFETYPDRKTGAKVGLYSTTAENDFIPYIIPQDYGNKTDVRWLKLTDASGTGFKISGGQEFNASLQKYRTGNLDRAHYPFQLKEEGVVTLNLDQLVTGVGGTALSVLNPYRVFPADTGFTFRLSPIFEERKSVPITEP